MPSARPGEESATPLGKVTDGMKRHAGYFLRWRILERMRRFLRPSLRRPLPVFFVPTRNSVERIVLF